MRLHDRTNGQGWPRAGHWAALALLAWLASARPSPAQEAAGPDGPAPIGGEAAARSGEPVDLSAERIWAWERGDVRYAVLDGKVAALKGVDGLRSQRAVVRITPASPFGAKVDVHAEGQVRFTNRPSARRQGKATLLSGADARLRPYGKAIVQLVAGPPAPFADLVARAFPEADGPAVPPSEAAPAAGPEADYGPVLVPIPDPAAEGAAARVDGEVREAQFGEGFDSGFMNRPMPGDLGDDDDVRPFSRPGGPGQADQFDPGPGTQLTPLLPEVEIDPDADPEAIRPIEDEVGVAPVIPGSQRMVSVYPRDSTPITIEKLPPVRPDLDIYVIRGGVQLVTRDPKLGIVDVTADSAVVWRGNNPDLPATTLGADQAMIQDPDQALEFYLEGNVIFRQDERTTLGNVDQRTYRATRAFYDARTDRFLGLDARADIFVPGLITPFRITSPRVEQSRPPVAEAVPGGRPGLGLPEIRADQAMLTGSRFPFPGYRFNARTVHVDRVPSTRRNPITGTPVAPEGSPAAEDLTWRIDSRSNVFYIGDLPVFYWPRFVADADDLDPPLRQISFRANNYFGQQFLTDWSGFKLLGIRKPGYIDNWNIDLDYLSARGIALGSGIGWFGRELAPGYAGPFFGYFDIWGLRDNGTDVLGAGPAVITDSVYDGRTFTRDSVPPLQRFRGRWLIRHMQSFLTADAAPGEDFRLQLENAYYSDRNFLEQYYKRLFETGLDQATLGYLIRQRENRAFTVLAEANLMPWYTDSQWLPRVDYYRLGDSIFDLFTYYHHSGINYANVHTANEVNNPTIFGGRAFLPFDPVSNTSGPFTAGRAYTNHELNLPINLSVARVTPYVQGQAIGWTNQLDGEPLGRLWGAAGGRVEMMAWRTFPSVESELMNVHGLAHKMNFIADYRTAYSTVGLNEIAVQDDLDDNTYEFVRRYYALSEYAGSLLPPQYDPRLLTLRRTASPITFTNDVQDTIQTLDLAIHQRLQTKRGPEGRRHILDYMLLDLRTTYFPQADRDNFGKPFGQNMYNYEWFVGDRTSIVSNGWFEFFDIGGQPLNRVNPQNTSVYPNLAVITTGVSISRPPRGHIFLGYSVLNSGTIRTSALISQFSYWMSPKWFATFSNTYDFGNAILLGSMFSVTRIGADFLTSVGLSVDPQRQSYMFGFELVPRISPNLRLGSASGPVRFDSRFAPVQ